MDHLKKTPLAHMEYFKTGTLHGNINPYVLFEDSRTGRGFLADYEYPANVIAPNGYIPLAVRGLLERPETAKAFKRSVEEKDTTGQATRSRGM